MNRPYRIAFVCLGNICRSPMAESVLTRQLAEAGLATDVEVDSAGTGGWHVGDGVDRRAVDALQRRGYQSVHRARQFQRADFAVHDLIVAIDEDNARDLHQLAPDADAAAKIRLLRSFDSKSDGDLAIPDPYYGTEHDFEHALDLIEASCDGLVAWVRDELA
ncbi:MAG TPA: low molecular weight protein-tyrosine-phosphatase [Acidimicrobiales bacterium]|nr:low molecular weight protein-tyrosine-phosphatase [Acidimicrobiales bacterium]